MVVYSFSQINLYQQCPKKYQFRYLDKIEREFETTPDLLLGSCVHGALERLYQQISIFLLPEKEQLLDRFYELRELGEKNAENEIKYLGELKKEDYLRRGKEYLHNYYQHYHPFNQGKLIATEKRLIFELSDHQQQNEKIKFTGFIDRLDKEGDTFIINDYKTNKHLPSTEDSEFQDQLTLYAKAIQQHYPDYQKNIKARLYFLHFELVNERTVDDQALQAVEDKYYQLASTIEKQRFHYNMGDQNAFPTQKNPYCNYCEYYQLCPLRKHFQIEDEIVHHAELGTTTIKKLVDLYAKINQQEKETKLEKEILKEVLLTYSQENNFQQLAGNEYSIKFSPQYGWKTLEKEDLKTYLLKNNLLEEASDISHHKMNKLIQEEQVFLKELKDFGNWNESYRLNVSKLKKADQEAIEEDTEE